MQETQVQSLGGEDPLNKEMATHSNIIAWKIPWTEEPGRLQSMGSQRVRHDWACTHARCQFLTTWFHSRWLQMAVHLSTQLEQVQKPIWPMLSSGPIPNTIPALPTPKWKTSISYDNCSLSRACVALLRIDNCQLCCVIPACSAAWLLPAEQHDSSHNWTYCGDHFAIYANIES